MPALLCGACSSLCPDETALGTLCTSLRWQRGRQRWGCSTPEQAQSTGRGSPSPARAAIRAVRSSGCLAGQPRPWQPSWQYGTALRQGEHAACPCVGMPTAARAQGDSSSCRQIPEPKLLCGQPWHRQPWSRQPRAGPQACSPRAGRASARGCSQGSAEPGALQRWPHAHAEQQHPAPLPRPAMPPIPPLPFPPCRGV